MEISQSLGLIDLKAKSSTGKNLKNEVEDNSYQIFENKIERKWLTSKEVAHYLSISENALRIMVYRNQIVAYKFGRRLRFQLNDCKTLIAKKEV